MFATHFCTFSTPLHLFLEQKMDSLGILCVTKLSRLFINPKLEVVLVIFKITDTTSIL